MKNLKLIFGLGAIALASNLMSCEQDNLASAEYSQKENAIIVEPGEIKLKLVDLPNAIKGYLESNYKGFVFLEAKKITSTAGANVYMVKFLLKFVPYEIKFDAEGKVLSQKKGGIPEQIIKESELLSTISTYLKANYNGYKFISAKKYEVDKKAYFEVKIKNSNGGIVELKFDSDGKILITNAEGQTTASLKESELLPNIISYLKSKYTAYTLISAKKVSKNGVIYYELKVKSGNNTFEIKFNANGAVVESSDQSVKSSPITSTSMPASVQEYLKANYAGYTFISGERTEKATGTFIYLKIKLNNITYELKFDGNGIFQSASGSNKTSEVKVALTDLPLTASSYLKTTFTQMVFISGTKVTKNESVTYVIKIKSGQKEYTVIFDSSGKMISNKRS
jgi:uncharacterized membrane protein YkoI